MMLDLPSGNYRFIALDVETAGRDSGSICQIGIACVDAAGLMECWSTLINPQTEFHFFNIRVHGIRPHHVKNAPLFPAIWQELKPLLSRHKLIQHSSFDSNALDRACLRHDLPEPDLRWYDSIAIAKKAWPDFKGNGGYGLGHLKDALSLDFRHHDAEEDARAAAEVVLQAETVLGRHMIATDHQLGLF